MIAIHADVPADLNLVEHALGLDGRLRSTTRWKEFMSWAARSSCAVLMYPRLPTDLPQRAAELRETRAALPVVLVTDSEPGNVKRLASAIFDAVVWSTELQTELGREIERLTCGGCLLRLAQSLEFGGMRDPVVGRAISKACRSDPLPGSIKGLVHLANVDRTTFWRHWRRIFPAGSLEPRDLLLLLRTVRAIELRAAGLSWVDVKDRSGIVPKELALPVREAPSRHDLHVALQIAVETLERAVAPLLRRATAS